MVSNSMMTDIELEKAALRGEAMPDWMPAPKQLMFLSMRMLYREYHAGHIEKAAAGAEKKRIMAEYHKYTDMMETARRLCHTFSDTLKDTSADRSLFAKMRSKGAGAEELLPVACRIASKATGDQSIKEAGT